ncbi:serine protease [Pseudoalteromonas sp. Of7M-16]|uniref:S1 family peptidase n=1 Tax=Pseudoalteromonas sp. Of7M-16 TaxID=2917756 RepID=UPI001EF4D5B3|nr:serine protease [Pseudoalteromonas sp. Of7M-16]MCG7550377.1 serine protease [Pseudoalteromonas sp. Of7M-16]
MGKLICRLKLLICILVSIQTLANINPEQLSLSTVRVVVKKPHNEMNVASGFLWQKPQWVVTSLHVLDAHAKSRIIIEFGKKKRLAKVLRVLPEADLVLLEVTKPPKGWLPVTYFKQTKPKYREHVTALGFHHGALAMSTRELLKGYAKPETLKQFLPPYAVETLKKTNIPDIEFPIYYLDGSLLPGFSGAPVFDNQGKLVGIGNGGLENGAANVSWVIPATNLTALVNSKQSTLPAGLHKTSKLFTLDKVQTKATLNSPPKRRIVFKSFDVIAWLFAPAYAASDEWDFGSNLVAEPSVVQYQNFEFYKIKTRSMSELISSTATPSELHSINHLFKAIFGEFSIDFEATKFDIYSDAYYGINIVVPAGARLYVDEQGYLLAKSTSMCRLCYYELQYHARTLSDKSQNALIQSPTAFFDEKLTQHWQELNDEGEFEEYVDFRLLTKYGGKRFVANALFANFNEPLVERFEVNYVSVATNRESWLQTQAINNRFDAEYMQQLSTHAGLNCQRVNLSSNEVQLCQSLVYAYTLLASVHLTGFSNRFYPL